MYGTTRAPELDRPGLVWFNTPQPLSLPALRGRIVILDFWTFCCINCMHVLPTLRRIEEAFPDEVAVIGVHSPKFAAEREQANVAHAIARYGVRHPVVHDPYMMLWDEYAIHAWPTLVFISPDGQVIGQVSGEPDANALMDGIAHMITQFRQDGSLDPDYLPLSEPEEVGGRFSFPGKIKPCPTPQGTAWALADSGHHQIVLLDDQGAEIERFGSGQAGFADGIDDAAFNLPQGLACDDRFIWVADTGNHALRRIDRASGRVETVSGTGRRGPALQGTVAAAGLALASPWDVALVDGLVYFANAGSHQIALYDPAREEIRQVAGTGGEDLRDGPALQALLAQPSGLALGADGLYFADSETSAIRRLTLGDAPRVETIVGQGLFDFGNQNGPLAQALLQHPLGLAVDESGVVLVADSYNGCIRRLNLEQGQALGLNLGACRDDVCVPLAEPAGIAVAGYGRYLLSDTNNHRIVEVLTHLGQYRTWAE